MKCSTRIIPFLLIVGTAFAQGTREDYARAERVMKGSLADLIVDGQVAPNWIRQSSRFWYRKATAPGGEEKEFLMVDAERGTRGPAFDHAKLAAALSKAAGKTYGPRTLPFDRFTLTNDGKAIQVNAEGTRWNCDLAAYNCVARGPAQPEPEFGRGGRGGAGGPAREPGRSPDGAWVAFVRDNNLWVRSVVAGQEYPLTTDGTELEPYAKGWPNLGDFVREAAGTAGSVPPTESVLVSWSPDSTKVSTCRLDMRLAPPAFALQVNPPNRFLPYAYTYAYAYPSAPVLPTAKLLIIDVKTGKRVDVQGPAEEILYGGGARASWFRSGKEIYFRHIERGYKRIQLLAADAETGKVRVIIDENSKDYVEASKFQTRFVNKETEIVMTSERDGWNHIYLHDAATGAQKNRVTAGEWAVRSIDRIDEAARVIYFSAGGREPGDPYLRYLYRVNFDGSNLALLTPESGDHQASFSEDGKYFVDNYSRVDLPTASVLRRASDGSVVLALEKTDISKLVASGWKQPERFNFKGRDGKTDIYGVLWRPTNFDPSKKYPIIEQIYAGPQGHFAPASFAAYRNGCQVMAELGALCVMIDGMGTDGRSHAFHAVSWKNLGDGGLPDHIAVLKQLAAKYPYFDLARGVGIYGHSAGGYNSTNALLTHPEIYKVAVSSAGNHDHRLDKAGWVEQWMSYPAGRWYEEQSNITLAPKLEGKLMLAVGEVDDNVTPVSTLKLAAALVQAGKDFDLIIMPNAAHGFGNDPYFVRRRWDFFTRHLLGVNPPENYKIAPASRPAGR